MKRCIPLNRRKVLPNFTTADMLSYLQELQSATMTTVYPLSDMEEPTAKDLAPRKGISVPEAFYYYNDDTHCLVSALNDAMDMLYHYATTGELAKKAATGFVQWLQRRINSRKTQ